MKRLAWLLVGILYPVLAIASPEWPNEPSGSVTLFDCGFSTPTCGGVVQDPYGTSGGSLTITSDGSAPLSPSNVLNSKLTYPNRSGGTELHVFAPRDIRNVYIGFYWRPSNPFGGNILGANKTFFVRSGYAGSNGVFLWVYRYGDTVQTNSNLGQFMWTTQIVGTNTDRCGPEGLQCYPNMGSGKRIFPGDGWHKIEAQFIGGSCPTCSDGTVKWWIDGVLDGYYPNFAYSTTFKEWVWSETWDGFGSGTVPAGYTSDQSHNIDHLHISSTDCDATCQGPGENIPPPSPPPSPTPVIDNPPGAPGLVSGFTATVGGVQ